MHEILQEAFLKEDWQSAAKSLKEIENTETDAHCRLLAAHVCLAQNHNNEALVLFLSAEEMELADWKKWTSALRVANPGNAVALYLHGDALARTGDLAGAETCFTQALEKNERLGLAWTARAVVRATQNRFDEAYLDLHRACEAEPTLAEAHAAAGCLEVLQCNAEGARDAFNEALKINPEFALAYNGRGCARYGLGQPDEAAVDFEMAQTLCPFLVVAEVNQGFVLAMVARQVDKHTPPSQKPGTAIETKSGPRSLVIDIPGIESQGAGRPEKWSPVLIGEKSCEVFNIRHEGNLGTLQQSEPGRTIVIPRGADSAVLEERLSPVLGALAQGKSVYAKVDQNIKIGGYMIGGKPEERKWAVDVSNFFSREARRRYPDISIWGNTYSEGTVVAQEMDITTYNGVILASYRFDAPAISKLAQANPQVKFLVSSGDRDLPHGIGPGLLSINEPNVSVVNLVSGDISPIRVHSQVQDPATRGQYQVKTGIGGIESREGTLGDLARSWKEAEGRGSASPQTKSSPISQSPLLTPDGLETAYKQRGFDSVYHELTDMRQKLVAQCWEVNRWMQKEYGPGVDRLNQGIIAVEATKSGIRVGKMLGILATGNLSTYFGQGSIYLGKDAISAKLETLPSERREIAKTILAGMKENGTFDFPAAFLEANWDASKGVMKAGIDLYHGQATQKLQSIIVNPLTVSKIEDSCQRLVAMEIARNPDTFKAKIEKQKQALTGISYSAKQPWSQMPELMKAVTPNSGGGPVVVMGQDRVRSFAFERMLNNQGISSVGTSPLNQKDLDRLRMAINPASVVAFKTDLNDMRRKLLPVFPPVDHGGGGGASVSPSGIAANMLQMPRSDGNMVKLPLPSSLQTPSGNWGAFQPWTPKGNVGGVDTKQLEWVFVDRGDWPVITFFTLAYTQPVKESQGDRPK
ncbi:MAG: tetratricopeptide repeat protein [Candidatus Sumerlaeota bacterium]|nr:tetratricopeptide repeat protein [Candidatus Sumerlaeota bacterium]